MDAILDKLTEIENAASAIVRHAEEQKDVLGQEFDEDLENKTKARLEKIREQLEKEQSRVLNSSSGASEDTICSLRKEYEEKHTEYAHEILRRITEV
jgi:vacuolar-type H+-ATPase subunit H